MIKNTPLIVIIIAISMNIPVWATENFSVFLVRHAEKQQGKDPKLTQCGKFRAKQLATLLDKAKIKRIYSTSYRRTRATAAPLAQAKKIAVTSYDPRKLPQLAQQLSQYQENTLVVGHSNTTPQLAEILSDMEVASINESEYQLLYQINFINGEKSIIILKQPLQCL